MFIRCVGLRLSDIGCRQLLGASYWTQSAPVLLGVRLVGCNKHKRSDGAKLETKMAASQPVCGEGADMKTKEFSVCVEITELCSGNAKYLLRLKTRTVKQVNMCRPGLLPEKRL